MKLEISCSRSCVGSGRLSMCTLELGSFSVPAFLAVCFLSDESGGVWKVEVREEWPDVDEAGGGGVNWVEYERGSGSDR